MALSGVARMVEMEDAAEDPSPQLKQANYVVVGGGWLKCGFYFVGDEDGVVGCGVDGSGNGGDGGRCGGPSSSSSSLQGGKRQDERRQEERRRKRLLLLRKPWLLQTQIRRRRLC